MCAVINMTPETENVCKMIKGAINDEATAGPMYKAIVDSMPNELTPHKIMIESIIDDEKRHKEALLNMFTSMECE